MLYKMLTAFLFGSVSCTDRILDNDDNYNVFKRIEVPYGVPETIYQRLEKILSNDGVMISTLLFVICAGICIILACIYCCYINYTDNILESEVTALAQKLKPKVASKGSSKHETLLPIPDNCENAVIEVI